MRPPLWILSSAVFLMQMCKALGDFYLYDDYGDSDYFKNDDYNLDYDDFDEWWSKTGTQIPDDDKYNDYNYDNNYDYTEEIKNKTSEAKGSTCSCNGKLNKKGTFPDFLSGKGECRQSLNSRRFCYVNEGDCQDQRSSASMPGWFWSYQACLGRDWVKVENRRGPSSRSRYRLFSGSYYYEVKNGTDFARYNGHKYYEKCCSGGVKYLWVSDFGHWSIGDSLNAENSSLYNPRTRWSQEIPTKGWKYYDEVWDRDAPGYYLKSWKEDDQITVTVLKGIDGGWSDWGEFGRCSATCRPRGTKTRRRKCNNPRPENGGRKCEGSNKETVECDLEYCVINGRWSAWSEFGPCSARCGSATKRRERTCSDPAPAHGGKMCSGPNEEINNCDLANCVNCPIMKSCSECLTFPSCQWCKEPGYSEPRCNETFHASPCDPNETLDPVSSMAVLEDNPTDWRNQMRPEHVKFSLRPHEKRSVDITYVAIINTVIMLSDASDDIKVTIKTTCNSGKDGQQEGNKCSGLLNGRHVTFTADIEVVNCPKDKHNWNQTFEIFTEDYSFSERMTVDVDLLCGCECELSGNHEDECPAPQDPCLAKTSCTECLEDPQCAWRKSQQTSPEGDSVPHCFSNDVVDVSEDIMNPHGDVQATQNIPLNMTTEDVFFKPQQISVSLRPGEPQVIDFLWGKRQPKYDSINVELGNNAADYLKVTFITDCQGKLPKQKKSSCSRLFMGQEQTCPYNDETHERECKPVNNTIEFQATIELLECPLHAKDWKQSFKISPVNEYTQKPVKQRNQHASPSGIEYYTLNNWVQGLDATLNVDLTLLCQECDCQKPSDSDYEEYSAQCSGHGTYKCGECHCHPGRTGLKCEVEERLEKGSHTPSPACLLALRKPSNGVWSCVEDEGLEGCQLVCPPGYVAKSGSFIHCDGTRWSKDPKEFSCVLGATLVVGSGDTWYSLKKGTEVEALGKTNCNRKLERVPNMVLYAHTVDLLDGKVIVCGGAKDVGFFYLNTCQFLMDMDILINRVIKNKQLFVHHSNTVEERKNHASVVIKDRLYLIGGDVSPNTTEYLSLTKEAKPEKWMIGCGESKVTATEDNLEEILDFMDNKLGPFGILTVANGQVLGRSYGGIINQTDGEGNFHLLEIDSGGVKMGPSYQFITSNERSNQQASNLLGVYHESCRTATTQDGIYEDGNYKKIDANVTAYIKPATEDHSQLFLYLNRESEWVIGSDLSPAGVLMKQRTHYEPLVKYKEDYLWLQFIDNDWKPDEQVSILPYQDYGTWNKGFDLGLDFTNACAVKNGAETFLAIGVGDMSKNVVEYNITDGSRRQLTTQLKIGRYRQECVYIQHDNKRMIIIAGGLSTDGDIHLKSTEILDLDTETMEEAGDMNFARKDFVLAVTDDFIKATKTADPDEIFDAGSKSWKLSNSTRDISLSWEEESRGMTVEDIEDGAAATGVPYSLVGLHC